MILIVIPSNSQKCNYTANITRQTLLFLFIFKRQCLQHYKKIINNLLLQLNFANYYQPANSFFFSRIASTILTRQQIFSIASKFYYPCNSWYNITQIWMGGCVSIRQPRPRVGVVPKVICPICEVVFDTAKHKPYFICTNQHGICLQCLSSIRMHNSLKKKMQMECPFCKAVCHQNLTQTDAASYSFLTKEEDVLNRLSDDKRKLYAFSTVYLPTLNKIFKQNVRLQGIDALRIRGRMLQEYQVFQLDMLQCLPNLKRLYLKNGQIKAIDNNGYTLNKLVVLNLTNNLIYSTQNLIGQKIDTFRYLKQLILAQNQIESLKGIHLLKFVQILNLSHNKIKAMTELQEMPQLRELNLQFNNIIKLTFYPEFTNLRALCLFGNQIATDNWTQFMTKDWNELRLLTLTVSAFNSVERITIYNKLKKSNWTYLKLIVADVSNEQHEQMDHIDEQLVNQQLVLLVELKKESYEEFISDKQCNLFKAMNAIKKYDRKGENVNFKPEHFDILTYSMNQLTGVITRQTDRNQKDKWLYSAKPVTFKSKTKRFMAFKTKSKNVVIGISTATKEQRLFVDLSNGSYFSAERQGKIMNVEQLFKDNIERSISLCLDLCQKQYLIYIDNNQVFSLASNIAENYLFYVGLLRKGDCLRLIWQQTE